MTATTQSHTPVIPACRTQDTICQWADVRDGDLAVYLGRLEQVDGLAPWPHDERRIMVLMGDHWHVLKREDWTAVRRYITEGEQ